MTGYGTARQPDIADSTRRIAKQANIIGRRLADGQAADDMIKTFKASGKLAYIIPDGRETTNITNVAA